VASCLSDFGAYESKITKQSVYKSRGTSILAGPDIENCLAGLSAYFLTRRMFGSLGSFCFLKARISARAIARAKVFRLC
jgi:hypothetical protein